jgi:hypothetical protein
MQISLTYCYFRPLASREFSNSVFPLSFKLFASSKKQKLDQCEATHLVSRSEDKQHGSR